MDSLQTDLFEQNRMTKRLFQDLFAIQLQLEKFQKPEFEYQQEVNEISQAIDQMMERLIINFDPSIE